MLKKLYYLLPLLLLASCSIQEKTISVTPQKEANFHENFDYKLINPQQKIDGEDNKIEVVEMFFFACPHCYKLEPTIELWLKKQADDVKFIRVPAIIGPTWAIQAKAFYVAEKLGMSDVVRKKLFEAIHKEGKQIYNEYSLMTFFSELGVSQNRFLELYESEEVVELASKAREKTVNYGIRGVPAIIVNGKYYTATYFKTDHNKMLEVVDFLIEKERKEKLVTAQLK
ncbi:Periplasmic thiol:disulfide interchange protein DsbA [hydrothermal vent metagenome]|uniref:Thiol:disulfide interchange protein DsbA n=1 Tax=hydrothermal vent metagenome TaxID=652676 RepID=A0A3B1A6G5_9ZZZZ